MQQTSTMQRNSSEKFSKLRVARYIKGIKRTCLVYTSEAFQEEIGYSLNEEIRKALRSDRIIDIITIGAKSGLPRKKEIAFTNVNGRIIICGGRAPRSPRDWFANLKANPEFTFCLKQSLNVELPARAVLIVDPDDRRQLMSAPET